MTFYCDSNYFQNYFYNGSGSSMKQYTISEIKKIDNVIEVSILPDLNKNPRKRQFEMIESENRLTPTLDKISIDENSLENLNKMLGWFNVVKNTNVPCPICVSGTSFLEISKKHKRHSKKCREENCVRVSCSSIQNHTFHQCKECYCPIWLSGNNRLSVLRHTEEVCNFWKKQVQIKSELEIIELIFSYFNLNLPKEYIVLCLKSRNEEEEDKLEDKWCDIIANKDERLRMNIKNWIIVKN